MGSGSISTLRKSISVKELDKPISDMICHTLHKGHTFSRPVPVLSEHPNLENYPSYYVEPIITDDVIKTVRKSWQYIIEDTGQEYLTKKLQIDATSCWAWFYMSFYDRLFTKLPEIKSLFIHDASTQGKALIGMISLTLGLANITNTNIEEERKNFEKLAVRHVYYGVTIEHYGVFGEVLFLTLQEVLGDDFDEDVKQAWLHIWCFILKHIIPVAVKTEQKRKRNRSNSDIDA